MRAALIAGIFVAAAFSPALAQSERPCLSCPQLLNLTPAQWSCLSPRLAEHMRSRRNPVFVPLPESPNCTPTLSTVVTKLDSTKLAPNPRGFPSVANRVPASVYLTKRQLRCLSAQRGEATVDFAQCR